MICSWKRTERLDTFGQIECLKVISLERLSSWFRNLQLHLSKEESHVRGICVCCVFRGLIVQIHASDRVWGATYFLNSNRKKKSELWIGGGDTIYVFKWTVDARLLRRTCFELQHQVDQEYLRSKRSLFSMLIVTQLEWIGRDSWRVCIGWTVKF